MSSIEDIFPDRAIRALTEPLLVYEDDPDTWGDDEVAVYSEDRQYIVNLGAEWCSCDDARYRGGRCKHIWVALYATRRVDVPDFIDTDALSDHLRGRVCDDEVR